MSAQQGAGGPPRTRPTGRRALLATGLTVLLLGGAAAAVLRSTGAATQTMPVSRAALELVAEPAGPVEPLRPGSGALGSLRVDNASEAARTVADLVLAAPTSPDCRTTGISLAPTVPPTRESPLVVPPGGSTTLEYTAYMDGEADDACQGATLTSEVLLDGEPAGTVTLAAAVLEQPPAPTGGLTTSTRAAVHWSASTAADPGWVVERTVAGTADWHPACGSSASRPVRALACTDTGLTARTAYAYRVTLRTGHWHMTSRPSAPVTTQDRPSA